MFKPFVFVVAAASLFAGSNAAGAAAPEHIYVKDKLVAASDALIVDKGTTLVPIHAVAGPLGLSLSWNAAAKTATFGKWAEQVTVTVGSGSARVGGTPASAGSVKLDVPVRNVNGRIYIPLRFLAQQFGYRVSLQNEDVRVDASLSPAQLALLRDGDLAEARRLTLSLMPGRTHYAVAPLTYTHEREGYNKTYMFPEGRSDRLFVVNDDQASYAELTEDGWIVKWQAHVPVGEADTIELLRQNKVTDAVGRAPAMTGSYLFYSSTDQLTTNILSSGRLSDKGKEILGWRASTQGEPAGQEEGQLSLTLPDERRASN